MNTSDFMGAFLEELDEMLVQMEQKIIELEANGDDDDTIQELFRVAHTLKGSCAAMGFEDMKDLTHEMEQVLDEVRNHRLHVSSDMIQLLFQCFDGLQDFKTSVSSDEEPNVQVDRLISALRSFLAGKNLDEESVRKSASADTTEMMLTTEAQLRALEAVKQGQRGYRVVFYFDHSSIMRGVRAYLAVDSLRELGDVLQVTPQLEEMESTEDDELSNFEVVFVTQAEPDGVRSRVATSEYARVDVFTLEQNDQADASKSVSNEPDDTSEKISPVKALDTRQVSEEGPPKQAAHRPKRKAQSVRVDVEQLETLMNLVGELVIDQARLEQVNRNLSKRYKADRDVTTLGDVSTHVSRIVGELQANIMTARMLPIESLFDRFPRVVRDLAHALNKDVHLSIEGKETRLDRTVIEEIADPLIHLIRNAVDHGIEPVERRVQAGKPETGTISLKASHEDNRVVITVQDDGAGMDAKRIRQAAIDKGVITQEEADQLSETECLYLIFRAGFSTADKLTDISGRGVGMDIVRNNIEHLNGTIEIHTELGKGTIFRITLPLTLAIIKGLLVGVADRTFVIPISNVFEIVRIQPDSIQSVHGRPTILLRGQATPVVYLREYFHLHDEPAVKKYLPVVVVGAGERRIAMVVDELNGNQEIVKKTLADRVETPDGIAGATILGDGLVGLILDIATISKSREQSGRRR
ncbi:chemotaxis protein CheA [Alicyclobacillus mengziensis]|uniref:Chemotaxis protein CheA n=1 Tax=Alicyclobacillus mengziensis TaxID=2931921 RepID=A0A9X7Z7P7_9BACL|nr:chemotaxis protein CheA [Alicyclobacillus mengziensis]QSO47433.1 chemotaxis protein CheA [Alicyclobacillus mengziensis]QSO47457.1 chemotaxis protein CheA [Alicyclobacillus mengziensis]